MLTIAEQDVCNLGSLFVFEWNGPIRKICVRLAADRRGNRAQRCLGSGVWGVGPMGEKAREEEAQSGGGGA